MMNKIAVAFVIDIATLMTEVARAPTIPGQTAATLKRDISRDVGAPIGKRRRHLDDMPERTFQRPTPQTSSIVDNLT
jgi:hypothetical protein